MQRGCSTGPGNTDHQPTGEVREADHFPEALSVVFKEDRKGQNGKQEAGLGNVPTRFLNPQVCSSDLQHAHVWTGHWG